MRRDRENRAWLLPVVLLVLGGLVAGTLACDPTPPGPGMTPTAGPIPTTPVVTVLPDLVVDIKGPDKARPGEALKDSIAVEVTNKGDATAGPFSVGLYFSTDGLVDQRDALLIGGREFVETVGPGETILVGLNGSNELPKEAAVGVRYLGVVVDETNAVKELDETNNTAGSRIMITP